MKFAAKRSLALAGLVALVATSALAADDGVLITFGKDEKITRTDYDAALNQAPPALRSHAEKDLNAATHVLDSVLVLRALAQEARDLGLDKDPVVQAEMRQAVEKVLGTRRMDLLEKGVKFPDFDKAAREQYDLNKARYHEPEEVRAAHVLVSTKNRTPEEARARIEEVRAKAVAGEDFAALATEYTDDAASKAMGGNLGWFPRGRMVKPFEEAAFALKTPGEVSPVIETQFGYHVIKLIEHRAEGTKPFEEVKDSIVAGLKDRLIAEEKIRHLSAIRNDPSIKLNTEAIDALVPGEKGGKEAPAVAAKP